jgi:signal transduction histidine kinase
MGLQLHGLLGLVQNGSLERGQLAREVRTAIEQMRLLLESAEGFDGDVSLLVGDIRYRIEQRLQRQGIRLDWNSTLAQPQRTLAPQHAIALQRLVFEFVTNTLKHSGAQVVTLSIWDEPSTSSGLHLSYADDGCGYEADHARAGVGTRSIQRRILDLGAEFAFTSAQGSGVHIRLSIPANAFL